MREGLALGANAVLIGIAPQGGRLPEEWRGWLREALEGGCDIVSGLHTFLSDDPVLAARRAAARSHDPRRPPAAGRPAGCHRAGARTSSPRGAHRRDRLQRRQDDGTAAAGAGSSTRAASAPASSRPGQTGIMIEGWGIAVDAVVADFIAGAAEQLVLRGAKDADIVLVEGQGSINHPGYSGVTLGLLHGSCPDAMILCHQPTREYLGDYRTASWVKIPPLSEYVRLYESIGSAVHPTTRDRHCAQYLRHGRGSGACGL